MNNNCTNKINSGWAQKLTPTRKYSAVDSDLGMGRELRPGLTCPITKSRNSLVSDDSSRVVPANN